MSGSRDTQKDTDIWVAQQLAAFAPLQPGDLVVLSAILSYDAIRFSDEAA
jgi:hypothetical protein